MLDQPGELGRGAGPDRDGARLHFGKRLPVGVEAMSDPPFDAVDRIHGFAMARAVDARKCAKARKQLPCVIALRIDAGQMKGNAQ